MLDFPRLRRALVALVLTAIIGIYAAAGVRGVAFGRMWDEGAQIDGIRSSLKSLSIWPNSYYYGGIYYAPGYALLAPQFLGKLPAILSEMRDLPSRPFTPSAHPTLAKAQEAALNDLAKPDFVERSRSVFVAITTFTILWVFFATRSVTGSIEASLAAAAVVGFSWEQSYHGRWIAVDCVLGQFTALVLLLVTLALSAKSSTAQRWLFRAAAAAAGLGMGSKLPGMFLIVPVLVAMTGATHIRGWRVGLARAAEAAFIMLSVFVATTPGVVLDPLHFANDMFRVASDYNRIADDYPYCEASFPLRLAKIGAYWAFALSSHYASVSFAVMVLVLIGGFVGIRERQPKVIAILAFLVVYVGFIATQRLLIVRNLMSTLPALAILSAVGLGRCFLLARRWRFATGLLATGYAAISALDASWMWHAANTVAVTTDHTILTDLRTHLKAEPDEKFYIDPAISSALSSDQPEEDIGGVPTSSSWDQARYVVLYASAVPDWKANTPGFARYFGSLHANYDYYPGLLSWSEIKKTGNPIIVVRKSRVVALGVTSPPH